MERLNRVRLSGRASKARFHHSYEEKYYYKIVLTQVRKSGKVDFFTVIVEDSVLGMLETENKEVLIVGSIRSKDISRNGKPYNIHYITASSIEIIEEPEEADINSVEIIGRSCTKEPIMGITKIQKRCLTKILVAVNKYNTPNSSSDFINCLFWGDKAKFAESIKRKDVLSIQGRVETRERNSLEVEGEVETVYEVSVNSVEVKQ